MLVGLPVGVERQFFHPFEAVLKGYVKSYIM